MEYKLAKELEKAGYNPEDVKNMMNKK